MYHVSRVYLGLKPTFEPRIPTYMSDEECKKTPRICVSPSVTQCLLGIQGITQLRHLAMELNSGWYVYETKLKGRAAKKVSDFGITEEHWILEPTQFNYVGKVVRLCRNDFAIFKNKKIIAEID